MIFSVGFTIGKCKRTNIHTLEPSMKMRDENVNAIIGFIAGISFGLFLLFAFAMVTK